MTARDVLVVKRLRQHGIVNPILTLRAARKAGLPLDLACAFLDQESGGGRNVFGHDPTIFAGAGQVTKEKYLAYKRARGQTRMQGVGPMQLTWWEYQDRADRMGGCWDPGVNMEVGFRIAAAHIRMRGLMAGIAAYNGSGSAAQRYAVSVRAKARHWTTVLNAPVFRPQTIAGTHFTWAEAARNSGYAKVPMFLRANVVKQAKYMERLRNAVNEERVKHGLRRTGIGVLSWVRSPEHNHAVGGASQSRHMKADACDIAKQEINRLCPWKGGHDWYVATVDRIFSHGGEGIYPGGSVHCDSRGWRARWSSWVPGK